MRPCQSCGKPVANDETFCSECPTTKLAPKVSDHQQPKKLRIRVTTLNLISLTLDMLLTSVIIGIPIGIICTLVALFFYPNWWAVYYGFLFGLLAGVIFWLMGFYFFSQAARKPLQ